jgi:hypothetical protein
VDINRVTVKYTGHRLDIDTLLAAARGNDPLAAALAHAVNRAAQAIIDVETDLLHVADTISVSLDTVRDSLAAATGQDAPTVNPLGELQAKAPRFDALIGLRHERIAHLRTVMRLWRIHGRSS